MWNCLFWFEHCANVKRHVKLNLIRFPLSFERLIFCREQIAEMASYLEWITHGKQTVFLMRGQIYCSMFIIFFLIEAVARMVLHKTDKHDNWISSSVETATQQQIHGRVTIKSRKLQYCYFLHTPVWPTHFISIAINKR